MIRVTPSALAIALAAALVGLAPASLALAQPASAQNMRIERDSMGEVSVPASAYYGASTQRAIDNFRISESGSNKLKREKESYGHISLAHTYTLVELVKIPKTLHE